MVLQVFFLNNNFSKKINSLTLKAIAKDSLLDCISTGLVIISATLYMTWHINIDAYIGLALGLFIIKAGIDTAKDTIAPLLGQAPTKEFVDSIKEIVHNHSEVLDTHDLVVHDYGPGRVMISIHAEVPAEGDILELHDVIDNIEKELGEKLNCHAVIHLDPVVTTDPRLGELKEKLANFLHDFDPALSFHDFRMVPGNTHTNLIFDLVLPFGSKYTEDDIKLHVYEFVKTIADDTTYYAVMNCERSFI